MNIKGIYWLSGYFGALGIVTGEDEITGVKKAYIGQVSGIDEEIDTTYVAENGTPLPPSTLISILEDLGGEGQSSKLMLLTAEAKGLGSQLLDVQQDCIQARQLSLKILNIVHPALPSISELLKDHNIPIAWDDERKEFFYKDERKCRVCGCTEIDPCVTDGVPCHWLEEDLCSACVEKRNRKANARRP